MHPTGASRWSDTKCTLLSHTRTHIETTICSPQCKHICHRSCKVKHQKTVSFLTISLQYSDRSSVFQSVLKTGVSTQHHLCLTFLFLCSFTHILSIQHFISYLSHPCTHPRSISLPHIFAFCLAPCITFSSILQRERGKHYNP